MPHSESQIIKTLRKMTYPRGLICPECRSKRIYIIKDGDGKREYRCKDCLRRFSDISETVFHKTRIPLTKWLYGFEDYRNAVNFTARKLKNDLRISYTAARRMIIIFREQEKIFVSLLKAVS